MNIRHLAVRAIINLISLYQNTASLLVGPCCRYIPTCSDYMIDALQTKGLINGLALGVKRICRCHPLGGYGFDPVDKTNST
jgi:putative membrane protein insertion efficiency factor